MSTTIKLFRTSTMEAAACVCGDPGPIFAINSEWWHLMGEEITPSATRMQFDFRNCARCAPRYGKNTPPPLHSVTGQSCDWGGCSNVSVEWRWSVELSGWLPVCLTHGRSE